MSDFDENAYIPMIDAILSAADLQQVSVKRIRLALESLFATQFEDQNKKQINDVILDRHRIQLEKQEAKLKRSREQEDAKFAAELQDQDSRTRKKNGVKKEVKKRKRTSPSPGSTSISSLELNLSPKLSALLGETRLPRTQVVKKVWDYIKEHDLQNPNDKREIICDEPMQEIFGKKVTMFSMNKFLSKHLYKDDE